MAWRGRSGMGEGDLAALTSDPSCFKRSLRLDDDLLQRSGARQMRPSWAKHTSVGWH